MRRALLLGLAVAAPAAVSCGGGSADPQPLPDRPASSRSGKFPAELIGTWTATKRGEYELSYVFRRDGTYRHSSEQRQRRLSGLSTFRIVARGTAIARGSTLRLRPRAGTKELRDPAEPDRNYKRPLEKFTQQYGWSVRRGRRGPVLTMTIGGGLAVTYQRR
ncbi:MAG: hypothetical protein ACRDLQ_09565 [Solirubrobacterales bacterium]